MAVQITEVSAQAVKRNSPFDSAGSERRQVVLQKKMRLHQELADRRRIRFFDVFQNAHQEPGFNRRSA
jgi:hypothetical protein